MLNKPKGRLLSDRLRRPEEATFHYVSFGGITGFVVACIPIIFKKSRNAFWYNEHLVTVLGRLIVVPN